MSAGLIVEAEGGGPVDQERPSVEVVDKSQKDVLKLYKRAVDVLRDKRERELLAEALCDVGDLHVSGWQLHHCNICGSKYSRSLPLTHGI